MSASFILRLVISFGTLVLTIVIIDAVLPKQTSTQTITDIFRGEEKRGRFGGKVLSHFRVYLNDGTYFPIFVDDEIYFEKAETVILSRSFLLEEPTFIFNTSNSYGTIPASGIFSYYFAVVVLLFLSISYAMRYRFDFMKLLNASIFVFFLTVFTLILLF